MGTATDTQSTSTADDVKAKAGEAAGQAQEKLHDATEQAKERAGEAAGQAKGRVRDQVNERSTEFGGRARSTADDLRSVGDGLRNDGKDQPARLADQAADRIEQVAGYLERSDADRFIADLEAFGRKRPWAVIAGGAALGFVAARVLKTSSADRYRGLQSGNGGASVGTTASRPAATSGTTGNGSTGTGGAAGVSVGGGTTTQTGRAGIDRPTGVPSTSSPLDDLADRTSQTAGPVGSGGPSAAATDEPPTGSPRVPSAISEPDIDRTLPRQPASPQEATRHGGS